MSRPGFLTSSQVTAWTTGNLVIPSRNAYAATVVADSPLRYWRFEEASGAYQTTYGPSTAIVIGAPTRPSDGARGFRSVGFPSISDYVQLGGAGSLPDVADRGSFTAECWVRTPPLTDIPSGQQMYQLIGNSGQAGTAAASWMLWMGRTGGGLGAIGIYLWAGASAYGGHTGESGSPARYDDNAWHHIVMAKEGAAWYLYLDGALRRNGTAPGTVNAGSYAPVVGYTYGYITQPQALAFPGLVDEVALYAGALSAARVLAHYQAT